MLNINHINIKYASKIICKMWFINSPTLISLLVLKELETKLELRKIILLIKQEKKEKQKQNIAQLSLNGIS